jgi:hypothetical protein
VCSARAGDNRNGLNIVAPSIPLATYPASQVVPANTMNTEAVAQLIQVLEKTISPGKKELRLLLTSTNYFDHK